MLTELKQRKQNQEARLFILKLLSDGPWYVKPLLEQNLVYFTFKPYPQMCWEEQHPLSGVITPEEKLDLDHHLSETILEMREHWPGSPSVH